jgi:hypothetical protein
MPVKASVAAAKAVAADPQASNVAIAEKIGVSKDTVRNVRRDTQPANFSQVEKRRGRDGKMRSVPAFSPDDVDETDGVTADMVDAANATNRRRVFMRCAADSIRKAEQGAGGLAALTFSPAVARAMI